MKPPVNEDDHMKRWKGQRCSSDVGWGARSAGGRHPAFTSSLLRTGEGARDTSLLSRIELEWTTATTTEDAYDNHTTREGLSRLIETDRPRLKSWRLYLVLLDLGEESALLPRRDACIPASRRATRRGRGGGTRHAHGLRRRDKIRRGRKTSP